MLRTVLLCLTALLAQAAGPAREPGASPEEFWRQASLDARIDVGAFDRALMARAIFHESNRVRRGLGLPVFRSLPKLDEAADLEAAVGKVYQPPSHTNPFPTIGTPQARVNYVGLKPEQVAENIALLSVYDVAPDVGVGVVTRDGLRRFVHPQTLAELQPSTYRVFAVKVVQEWMNSPGHRVNLVSPSLLYLGCSVQPAVSLAGVDNLFCVQVFFTPR